MAALIHGSSYMTFDLDVLAPFTLCNWERILGALRPFEPRFHNHPSRIPLQGEPEKLTAFRMVLLDTTLGRLDILREIPGGTYDDLLPASEVAEDVYGGPMRVLGLDALIASKAALMREKDKPVVVELRAIRERLRGEVS